MIGGLGLQWQASFAIITLLYFYSHYLFASGAAHIGAMYTAFLSVSIAMGTPPLVVRSLLGRPVCRHGARRWVVPASVAAALRAVCQQRCLLRCLP